MLRASTLEVVIGCSVLAALKHGLSSNKGRLEVKQKRWHAMAIGWNPGIPVLTWTFFGALPAQQRAGRLLRQGQAELVQAFGQHSVRVNQLCLLLDVHDLPKCSLTSPCDPSQ